VSGRVVPLPTSRVLGEAAAAFLAQPGLGRVRRTCLVGFACPESLVAEGGGWLVSGGAS
jgi:hypothetical protein